MALEHCTNNKHLTDGHHSNKTLFWTKETRKRYIPQLFDIDIQNHHITFSIQREGRDRERESEREGELRDYSRLLNIQVK